MKGLRSVGITGTGSYTPSNVITNFDLEKMVDTSDEWIVTRTGIRERHIISDGQSNSDLSYIAGKRALEDAGVSPEEIDLIILATVSPDHPMPATACILQDRLGCKRAAAFDIFAGCSGFPYSLALATNVVATGFYNKVLIIGCDVLSNYIDWTDRNTCVLFGDGAGAAVVEPVEEGYGVLHAIMGAEGDGAHYIEMPAGGSKFPATHETVDKRMHYIKMKGNDVFRFAIRIVPQVINDLVDYIGIKKEDIDIIVPHQANSRILESSAKRLKIPIEKFFKNLEFYGNTSAASFPLALDEAVKSGSIKKGDMVLGVGFGAGLTYGGAAMKWAYNPRQSNNDN